MKSKFTWIFTLLLAFFVQFSFAQEKTVTGTVIATSDGFPIPGVNVTVNGTTAGGVQTGIDGKYSIVAPQGSTLVFTFVGMQTVSQVVGASNTINVSMKDDAQLLDEVVVVAYGVQKKESITGSIAEIKSEQIATITTGNILQGTLGKVAGVQVSSASGLPGDAPTIRMRGIGSISGSAAPLYVVDGVPFSGDVAMISGMDVESMTFLKDASAAALYGNRGANGVIIITTKKGKNQKSTVTIDSRTGFASRAVKEYDIMTDAGEYYEGYYQALKNRLMVDGQSPTTAANNAAAGLINGEFGLNYNAYNVPNNQVVDPTTGRVTGGALKYDEDWSEYLFGSGMFTQTHVSVAGGSDKTTHFFSAGYEKNEGYVVNSGLEKITARAKIDSQVTDWMKVGVNMGYTHILQKYLDGYTGGSNFSSPFLWTRTIAPIYPVLLYDNDGNPVIGTNGSHLFDDGTGNGGQANVPTRPYGSLQHPYATAINDIKKYQTDNLYASAYFDLKIADGLNFIYTATGDLFAQGDRSMDTPLYGDAVDAGGRVSYTSARRLALTQQQLLKYNKVFGDHGIDFLLGHETLDRRNDIVTAERSKLLLPDTGYVNHGAVLQGNSGYGDAYASEGFFSRLNYDFKSRYYLNASIRRDGSSRFHPDNRWGTFYGVGAAWRLKQESFLQGVSWINELRIKGSYGEQGNDNLSLGVEQYYLDNYTLTATTNSDLDFQYSRSYNGNRDLTWETNQNFNVGFDTRLFDRVNIEAEYFERNISDMLYNRDTRPSGNTLPTPFNLGDMTNKGFELTIDADIVKTDDLLINISANATHYKNEITVLANNGQPNNRQVDGLYALEEGSSRYAYFLREYAGVNHETGAALYWMDDAANPGQRVLTEGTANATPYKQDKTAIPDVYGGFGLNVNYSGFDLGVQFAYQFGGYAYDGVWLGALTPDRGSNLHRDFADTWTPENKDAKLPISTVEDPNQYYGASTLGLVKSDYLSIQNISLGYTFNKDLVNRIGLSSLRLYGLVDNVGIWTKRQGFDPRVGGVTGQSSNNYSLLRTTSMGLNIQF